MHVHLNILETCYQRSISTYVKITLSLLTLFSGKIICFLMWPSTSLYNSRTIFAAKALWLIRFSLNEIPSSGFDGSFILLSITSSPYQVISGTNVHNSFKYTTMIHAQLLQRPFNNSKSISCGWYCQCSLEYFHLYKTHLRLATLLCREKNLRLTSTL